MPFRAETIRGYLDRLRLKYLSEPPFWNGGGRQPLAPIKIRFRYNQDSDSIDAVVP